MDKPKNLLPEIAHVLEPSIPLTESLEILDTKRIIEELIGLLQIGSSIDSDMLNACFFTFYDEMTRKHPNHFNAILSFEENLENIGKKYQWRTGGKLKLNPGTSFNDGALKANNGLIFKKLKDKSINNEIAIFLAGYAIISEYETFGQMARATLQSTRLHSYKGIKPWEMESVVQCFFTIDEAYHILPELNSNHRSEICHIRNAFAHSHIKFLLNEKVELWDFCKNDNNVLIENYRECFSLRDLLEIFHLFHYRSNLGVFYATYGYYLGLIKEIQDKEII